MKYSFKTHWLHDEEKFQAQLLYNGKVIEEITFDYQSEMFEYIAEAMCNLQLAGEDWTFTY